MSRARVLWHYLQARRRRFADRGELEAWQRARLRPVLARAPKLYPFYASLAPRSLQDLPILDKDDVLARFADLNVRGVGLDECLAAARGAELSRDFSTSLRGLSVGLSSGTSGQQAAFLTSGAERDRWAGEVLAKALPAGLRAGARVTLVLRAGGPLYESVDGGRISFRFVDLAQPMDRLLQDVRDSAPTILVASPSVLLMVAAAGLDPPPERIFSAAEVLEPHDRAAIERGLGVRVDQVYQAAEGFLGISCAAGTVHLNEDLVIVERQSIAAPGTSTDGQPRRGERFMPVVTDLFRTSQAVLRRRLTDVLVSGDAACECGQPTLAIEQIVGRADDVLWLPRKADETRYEPFFPDFVRAAVLAAGAADFRAVQVGATRVRLATTPHAAFPAARASLAAALERAGIAPCDIEQAEIDSRDPLSKLRRVRREWSGPPAAGT